MANVCFFFGGKTTCGSPARAGWLFTALFSLVFKQRISKSNPKRNPEDQISRFQNSHPGTNAANAVTAAGIEPAQARLPAVAVPARVRNSARGRKVCSQLIGYTAVALVVVYHLIGLFQVEEGVGKLVFGGHAVFMAVTGVLVESGEIFLRGGDGFPLFDVWCDA